LQGRISWWFRDPALLDAALRHRSWCAEHPGTESNERLEFLGDAVLGLVVTDELYRTRPDMAEGELAKVRAAVVNTDQLARVAAELGVGPCLLLGRGEDASGGREKVSILADAMEALIAAVYLEGGLGPARRLVLDHFGPRLASAAAGPGEDDFKTRLQELAARRWGRVPRYRVEDEGPDHRKRFRAQVLLDGRVCGRGEGGSKKQAEQAAAADALWRLGGTGGSAGAGDDGERLVEVAGGERAGAP
jgi:ribonuclease-3